MRCKNCGWDNPDENTKCEKCNASLSSYTTDDETTYADDSSAELNPQTTVVGCSSCGYPVRPADTVCPNCNHSLAGNHHESNRDRQVIRGTVIQGAVSDKDYGNQARKRLAGFLVTYSRSQNGDFFPLYEGKNIIGRDDSSQICIQGDPNISEKHLSILFRPVDRKFKFKDEQSSNGTFVNGELTDEGELKNLDVIRIGATELLFMEIPHQSI